MRMLPFATLIATIAVLWILAATGAPAGARVPATPFEQYTITVRFVRDGVPVSLLYSTPPGPVEADGETCYVYGVNPTPFHDVASQFTFKWPMPPSAETPEVCSSAGPTVLSISVFTNLYGRLEGGITWTGGDATIDLQVPEPTPTPTPSPTPTPTASAAATATATATSSAVPVPAELPDTGGAPRASSQ